MPLSPDEQRQLLQRIDGALSAEPTTRIRWNSVRCLDGDYPIVGAPRVPSGHLRIEVQALKMVVYVEDGERHRRFDATTLKFEYDGETPVEEIPARVTDGVRAFIEEWDHDLAG